MLENASHFHEKLVKKRYRYETIARLLIGCDVNTSETTAQEADVCDTKTKTTAQEADVDEATHTEL